MQDRFYPGSVKSTSPDAIPKALRSRAQWMGTRFEARKGHPGKVDKPPYIVKPGEKVRKGSKTNPDNWTTFEYAVAALRRGDVDGIGFCFHESDPFYCIDFDGVIHTATGEIRSGAAEIHAGMNTYAETSCSGEGVHLLGVGTKPEWADCRSRRLGFEIEIYDRSRFLVMTGNVIGGHDEPQDRQTELTGLCRRLWPKSERMHSRGGAREHSLQREIEDERLVERARRARSGPKFRRLYDEGDTSGYKSPSEADLGLCNMLLFWTAGRPEQMIRLFEASALYRGKEKPRDYVTRTVSTALRNYTGPLYRPRDTDRVREEDSEAQDPLVPYLRLLLDPSFWTGRRAASGYKAYAAALILAEENGVVGDDGNYRIGVDVRRLAETAGMSRRTMQRSALPYLVQEKKLLRWRPGKRGKPGAFVLKNPAAELTPLKCVDDFNGVSSATAKSRLKSLRLFVRMRRGGKPDNSPLRRLGMVAVFAAVALLEAGHSGHDLAQLVESTGRRKDRLLDALIQLREQGIARQDKDGRYRLSPHFRAEYERVLEQSGVVAAERRQRYRHEQDRARRDAKISADKQPHKLRGKEHVNRVMERNRKREKERYREEQRRKVGETPETWIAGVVAREKVVSVHDLRRRFTAASLGGNASRLWRVLRAGPFDLFRGADGHLYVTGEGQAPDTTPQGDEEATLRSFITEPPAWLARQLRLYRAQPSRFLRPTCSAIAADVLHDAHRWAEVVPILEEVA